MFNTNILAKRTPSFVKAASIFALILSQILLLLYSFSIKLEGWKNTSKTIPKNVRIAMDTDSDYTYTFNSLSNSSDQPAFQWSMLHQSMPGICGHSKCFFRDSFDPEKVGYAIASHHPNTLQWTWSKVKKLQLEYGAQHVYLGPPESVKVSGYLVDAFHDRRKQNSEEHTMHQEMNVTEFLHLTETGIGLEFGKEDGMIIVQKMHVVPQPFLEVGHGSVRPRKVENDWPWFASFISEKESFSERLLLEEQKLRELLSNEPWLKQNFQVLIDTKGRILHFDLDRGFRGKIGHYEQYDVEKHLQLIHRIALLEL